MTQEEMIYASFRRIITGICASLQQRIWFQLTESESAVHGSILLREHVGLNLDDWNKMLSLCRINAGTFKPKGWEDLFNVFVSASSGYKYKLDRKKIDNKATWFVMLGPTAGTGCKDALVQIRSKIACPIFYLR